MNSPELDHQRMDLDAGGEARTSPEAFLASFDIGQVSTGPGCYIMQDVKGKPIYVGKAKNLRARVRTYLNASDTRYSVKFLMKRVARIDFLVTQTEKEALLLENSLIKQHRPRYNVQLKDDKTYISLRIDTRQDFPRITIVRRYKKDGAKYFGPYHSASSVHQTLRQLHRMFPLRTCTDNVMQNRSRPCLYYQMKQCVAPCVGYVSRDQYHALLDEVVMTLEGRSADLERHFKEQIQELAEKLEFEEAALVRDRLYALQRTVERQRTVDVPGAEDRDVFGYHNEGRFTEIQILFYRHGKMLGGRAFSFERSEMPLDELLSSFLLQYYSEGASIPREVLLPIDLEDAPVLSEVLSEQRETRVDLHCPQRGDKRALVEMACQNAERNFREKRLVEKSQQDTLLELQKALKLPRKPERIECFDISTIQGRNTVASMVTFTGGAPDKARYRRFSIKAVEGQDDFASMREVLLRRYKRAIEENDLPDFVLIDGGKGQLGVATAVFKDLGIEDLPHAGIAKARAQEDGGHSPERFFVPGRMNPIILPQQHAVIRLVSHIRDEAHRFAITYHRKKRNQSTLRSSLLGIPGVGPAKAKALLNKLGSVARIREATAAEIAALPGFSEELAESILHHLKTP
ncbi:MAG: excinuclease ABC subunit UvrC [Candidatus Hydrogenedentes bacterium]|nr:excinuclease ABC subunit UvrC [Candidatus Hydrogenedentota bacterium]